MTQVVDVAAELALLRSRVAALEELAKFFLSKSEGWGVSRNDPPGTPAFTRERGSHPTWGADSERPAGEDSSPLDPVTQWLKDQEDKRKQEEEKSRRPPFGGPRYNPFDPVPGHGVLPGGGIRPGWISGLQIGDGRAEGQNKPLDRVVDEWIRFQGDVQGAGR